MAGSLLTSIELKNVFAMASKVSFEAQGKPTPLTSQEKQEIQVALTTDLRKSKTETIYLTNQKERQKIYTALLADFTQLRTALASDAKGLTYAKELVGFSRKYKRATRFVQIAFRTAVTTLPASKDTRIASEMLRQAVLLIQRDVSANESIIYEAPVTPAPPSAPTAPPSPQGAPPPQTITTPGVGSPQQDVYEVLTPAQLSAKCTKINAEWIQAGQNTVGQFADFMVGLGFDEEDIIHAFQIRMKLDIEDKTLDDKHLDPNALPPNKKTVYTQITNILRQMSQGERESLFKELTKASKDPIIGESLNEAPLTALRKGLAQGLNAANQYKTALRPRPINAFKKNSRPGFSTEELTMSWKAAATDPTYENVVAFLGKQGFTSTEINQIFTAAKVQTGLRSERVVKMSEIIMKAELAPYILKSLKNDYKITESIAIFEAAIDDVLTPAQATDMIKFIVSRGFKKSDKSKTAIVNLAESVTIFVTEGITHLEELAIDDFLSALKHFDEFEISEKVDGANLQFGIDNKGFYTTREDKGGLRIYNVDNYPRDFRFTYQRSAHMALEKLLPIMKSAGLQTGCRIETEILFGSLPNAIRYNGEYNQIILLRALNGIEHFDKIKDHIEGKKVTVFLECPYTADGETISYESEVHHWQVSQTPITDGSVFSQSVAYQNLRHDLAILEEYLYKESGISNFTNAQVLGLPLNKCPESINSTEWAAVKISIKNKKHEIEEYLSNKETGLKYKIKQTLLNSLVRQMSSAFGPDIDNGGWIEGLVARHKVTGKQFKIVDKDMFGVVKDFLWKVRAELAEKPTSLEKVDSFMGSLLVGTMSAIGHPEFATTRGFQNIKKAGQTPEEIISNLSKDFKFQTTKEYLQRFLSTKIDELKDILQKYKSQKDNLAIKVPMGTSEREFRYDSHVNQRTLQVFADLFKEMTEMENRLKQAKSENDIVSILIGKQLGRMG